MCISKDVIFYIFTQQSHTYAGAVGFFMYFLCKYFYNVTHSNIHIHVIYKCKGTTSINLEFDFSSYENIVTTFLQSIYISKYSQLICYCIKYLYLEHYIFT